MNYGYRVEYSDDGDTVCIIPEPSIPSDEFFKLMKFYTSLGYKWWLPADDRRGYILSKKSEK